MGKLQTNRQGKGTIMNDMRKLIEAVEMAQTANPRDEVTLDIPLLIRLLEYSREDAKTDMDLHSLADNMINLSPDGATLTMADYEELVMGLSQDTEHNPVQEGLSRSEMGGIKVNLMDARSIFEFVIEMIEKSDINEVGNVLGINKPDVLLGKLKEGARALRHIDEAL